MKGESMTVRTKRPSYTLTTDGINESKKFKKKKHSKTFMANNRNRIDAFQQRLEP